MHSSLGNKGYALITGASSGIGWELAKVFAAHRHNVILVARREEKLKDLVRELDDVYGVRSHILNHDLGQADSVRKIDQWVRKNEIRVDFLVNNAGFVVYGNLSDTPWDEEQKMMQLHMHTAAYLIKLFLPEMLKNNRGRILNVCSTGSFVPGPYAAIYCATKAFLLSLSEAIAEETRGTKVTVTALCPGGTRTEFAEKAKCKGKNRAESLGMDAAKVARIAYRSMILSMKRADGHYTWKAGNHFSGRTIITTSRTSLNIPVTGGTIQALSTPTGPSP